MSKLNNVTRNYSGPKSVIQSAYVPGARTGGGAPGAISDSKTELFRLGSVLFFNDNDKFYEKGKVRDTRFTNLVEKVAVEDPTWIFNFLSWLRSEANIRTAAIAGAAHAVHARLHSKNAVKEDELLSSLGYMGINRAIIGTVLQRADEPGEFIAYWKANFGALPKPVKRGIADAAKRLYNEYAVLKYNTSSHGVQFADVLNLTHAKAAPNAGGRYSQDDLYRFIIDSRYDQVDPLFAYRLPTVAANKAFRARVASGDYSILTDAEAVKAAGLTWEDVLSLGGKHINKKQMWEAVIPSMGIFALVRNIRNFLEAGISPQTQKLVIDKLTNPEVIAKSRMFPYRFLAAYDEVPNLQYKAALETSVGLSAVNIPEFYGRTLVLVDTSGSMTSRASGYSKVSMMDQAALFGAILAVRNQGNVDLVAFASTSANIPVRAGTSVLPLAKELTGKSYALGGGTETASAVRQHYDPKKHKRVIILTDMQSFGSSAYTGGYYNYGYGAVKNLSDLFDAKTFVYAFDLGGYKVTDLATGSNRRYQLGGLTDATFRQIPVLESGAEGVWPWETPEAS